MIKRYVFVSEVIEIRRDFYLIAASMFLHPRLTLPSLRPFPDVKDVVLCNHNFFVLLFVNTKKVGQLSGGKSRHKKRAVEIIRRSMGVSGSFYGSWGCFAFLMGVFEKIMGVSGSFLGVAVNHRDWYLF